jgi:tetratricopeptide (TPR) repeat protein
MFDKRRKRSKADGTTPVTPPGDTLPTSPPALALPPTPPEQAPTDAVAAQPQGVPDEPSSSETTMGFAGARPPADGTMGQKLPAFVEALRKAQESKGKTVMVATEAETELIAVHLATKAATSNEPEVGLDGLRTIMREGSPPARGLAGFNLGQILQLRGDLDGAGQAYRVTADGPDAETAAMAALNLGILLYENGEVEPAKTMLGRAAESDHAEAGPKAAYNLGGLLAREGETEAGMQMLERAVDSGHPDESRGALTQLGALLALQGRVDEARSAFVEVIDSKHPEFAPVAKACLDDLHLHGR